MHIPRAHMCVQPFANLFLLDLVRAYKLKLHATLCCCGSEGLVCSSSSGCSESFWCSRSRRARASMGKSLDLRSLLRPTKPKPQGASFLRSTYSRSLGHLGNFEWCSGKAWTTQHDDAVEQQLCQVGRILCCFWFLSRFEGKKLAAPPTYA